MVYTHRWLGIAGGLLILMWFATGIVMVYHRMPELGRDERLRRLAPLDASQIRVSPSLAADVLGARGGFTLAMLSGRPVYRFGVGTVHADTGEPLTALDAQQALAVAAEFAPELPAPTHDALLSGPDQWTLQSQADLPLHRIVFADGEDTHLYVSAGSGEVVMRTTRSERAWAYAGAVLHWLYFTPFRARSTLWAQTVIWLSVAGCVLTLSGLLWGVLRFSPGRRHRPGGRRQRSPYSGLLRWHHYAGLLFGLFSFTWMLSGGLSMEPWSWHPGTSPTAEQRTAVSRGPVELARLDAGLVRAGVAALSDDRPVKEVRVVRFRGEPYLIGYGDAPFEAAEAEAGRGGQIDSRLVRALSPESGAVERLPDADIIDAAVEAMPGVGIRELTWLEEHDAYYYGRNGAAPLPVLKALYADAPETALYFDPRVAAITHKEERLTRWNRWLYRGLHSLDFPFLYERRPLWDAVVILLSIGGLVLAGTTILPGFRRLGRHLRRVGRR